MSIETGVLMSIVAACVAVATFLIARLKDAEERGALKQRVADLERRQDLSDAKIDAVLEKLDDIGRDVTALVTEMKHLQRENCHDREEI